MKIDCFLEVCATRTDRQTDGRTDRHCVFLSSYWSQKLSCYIHFIQLNSVIVMFNRGLTQSSEYGESRVAYCFLLNNTAYDRETCDQNERGNFVVFQDRTKTKKANPFYFLILKGVYFLHF